MTALIIIIFILEHVKVTLSNGRSSQIYMWGECTIRVFYDIEGIGQQVA